MVTVVREGRLDTAVEVDFSTEDGVAHRDKDYVFTRGTLFFAPFEVEKSISVGIIDDNVFEEDEHFYLKLKDPRICGASGGGGEGGDGGRLTPSYSYATTSSKTSSTSSSGLRAELANPSIATILILDDDRVGIFEFDSETYEGG